MLGRRRAKGALFNRAPTNNQNANVPAAVRTMVRGQDPSPGGLPLIYDNQVIGAIGVAGSDSLAADCARAGLAAVPGLQIPAPPAPPASPAPTQPQR